MGPCTKGIILCWIGNVLSGLVIGGGVFLAVLDDHYRGIGALVAIFGAWVLWYFKSKGYKETERHNKAIEKLTSFKHSPEP